MKKKIGKYCFWYRKNSNYFTYFLQFRADIFFIEENFAHFMNNLILPKKIEIYFSQESAVFTWDIGKKYYSITVKRQEDWW